MKIQQLITEALSLPNNAIAYHISQELAAVCGFVRTNEQYNY
ncbi:MAG: hypothetical protein RMY36_021155 [Nostoc sp. SerVER01]|nr:hypothetical protein [Nostoc sp. SerVER01]